MRNKITVLFVLAGACLLTSCVTIASGERAEALVASLPSDVEWGWRAGSADAAFVEAEFHPFERFNPTTTLEVSGVISAAAVVGGEKQIVANLVALGKKSYLAFPQPSPPDAKEKTKEKIYVEAKLVPGLVQWSPGPGNATGVLSSRALPNYWGEQLFLLDLPAKSVSIRSKVVAALLDEITIRFPGKDIDARVAFFSAKGTRWESLGVPLKVLSMRVEGEVSWYYVLRADSRVTFDAGSVRVFYPKGQSILKPVGEATFVESSVAQMREMSAFSGLKAENLSDTPVP